ncbi:MAG: hypothetical protein K0S34_1935 [Bacillales bacterium]|nr:hypothetical protein [Bacillales bacterium]
MSAFFCEFTLTIIDFRLMLFLKQMLLYSLKLCCWCKFIIIIRQVEDKLSQLEDKMTKLEDKLSQVEDKMTKLEDKLTKVEDKNYRGRCM